MSDITSKDIGELIFSHIEKSPLPNTTLLEKLANSDYYDTTADAETYITQVVKTGEFYDQSKGAFKSELDYDKIAALLYELDIEKDDPLVTSLKDLDPLFVYNNKIYFKHSIKDYRNKVNSPQDTLDEETLSFNQASYLSEVLYQFPPYFIAGPTRKTKSHNRERSQMESCI
jgi:hypothetical protein